MQMLSVIIPVYNERDNIEPLVTEIIQAFQRHIAVFEIIFVDDGSTDDTLLQLQTIASQYPCVKVLAHAQNAGQSVALLTGARAAQYPVLVTLDGDGQNDPKDIPLLLAEWSSPNQVILGQRQRRQDSLVKKGTSWVGRFCRRWILNDDCPDTGCSLKLFSREGFLALPHFNHFHRFLPVLFKRAHYQLLYVPVNHRERRFGVSKYGIINRLFVGIYDLIGVRWLLKRPCHVYQEKQ